MDIFDWNATIWVPKLYWSKSYIKKDSNNRNFEESYMIMDFIPWKTLYCCLIEKMVENFYQKYTHIFDESTFMIRYQNDFFDPQKLYSRSIFDFRNDALAGSALYEALEILQNKGKMVQEYDHFNYHAKRVKPHQIIMGMLQKDASISLFNKNDIWNIKEFLSWIKDMNEKWLYHRDLWSNNRNILFWKDGKFYIIDFGFSLNWWWEEDPFNVPEQKWNKTIVEHYQNDVSATKKEFDKRISFQLE